MLQKLLIEQITCLQIDVKDETAPSQLPENLVAMFALILSLCKELIKFPSAHHAHNTGNIEAKGTGIQKNVGFCSMHFVSLRNNNF